MSTWYIAPSNKDLIHYGVLGMKWGVRRYQNKDGSLTNAGKRKYYKDYVKSKSTSEYIEKTVSKDDVEDMAKCIKKIQNLKKEQKMQFKKTDPQIYDNYMHGMDLERAILYGNNKYSKKGDELYKEAEKEALKILKKKDVATAIKDTRLTNEYYKTLNYTLFGSGEIANKYNTLIKEIRNNKDGFANSKKIFEIEEKLNKEYDLLDELSEKLTYKLIDSTIPKDDAFKTSLETDLYFYTKKLLDNKEYSKHIEELLNKEGPNNA